jgi:hypothetical protein
MEVAIQNVTFLAAISNLAINQLMEWEAVATFTANVAFVEEPKWTTMMVKNMHQVVNQAVETLANASK